MDELQQRQQGQRGQTASPGLIGAPVDRVEGRLKVTGRALYAGDHAPEGKPAYGFIVESTIASGRIVAIDTEPAMRVPGVVLVVTHRNAPAQAPYGPPKVAQRFQRAKPALNGDRVQYYGQPVALVIADTFEAARAGAALVPVRYAPEAGARFDMKAELRNADKPDGINAGAVADTSVGNFDQAFGAAPVQVDVAYTTPYEHVNPMEPHATVARWQGDRLVVHTSTQGVNNCQIAVAKTFNMPTENVRVVCKHVGGGFGAKVPIHADIVLAAIGARMTGRPVKIALTRQQMFANTNHRTETHQRVRLGATRDGRLTALAHDVIEQCTRYDEFAEQTALFTRSLYAAPNRLTSHRVVRLDLPPSDIMRAPGEAPGALALECAMDELAYRLRLDPIELRVRNEPTVDPERNVPFSTRSLVACMREGASRFGWSRRPATPGSLRDGRWLVGYGMSAAIRPNYLQACKAEVALLPDATARVRLSMTDIGTGTYTILTQIAAQTLGLPMEAVRVELGDSDFPPSPGSGGSWGAASSGSAVLNACTALRGKLSAMAAADAASPLYRADPARIVMAGGRLQAGDRAESLPALLARGNPAGVSAVGEIQRGKAYDTHSQHAYGAHFAEVGVDADTGEIRLRRMLGVFAAGRILNPKTARSQMIGGMIWGVGAALMEESWVDPRYGAFVNRDLASYHVPAHADIPAIDAVFLEEHDDKANPLGAKGVGELGICGAGASLANAVFNATGVRVREYPLTLDKVLASLRA
jgi:xanthine dehydrogenase YagR molybdenum-binding subunit